MTTTITPFDETRLLFKGLFPRAEITPELADLYRSTLFPLDQTMVQDALRVLASETTTWTPKISMIMSAYHKIRLQSLPGSIDIQRDRSASVREQARLVERDNVIARSALENLPIAYLRSLDIFFRSDRSLPLEKWSQFAVNMTWAAHQRQTKKS